MKKTAAISVSLTVLLGAAAAFLLTPVPSALLVRALFDRDAAKVTAALAERAPRVEVTPDIAYRSEDPDAYLDVYRPIGTTVPLPTIVWSHGGAWLSGDRTDYAGYYARLADEGFTVVSLGYSIAPGHRYPTAVHQLNEAHAHLLLNAAEYGIDPDRIVLAGDSAGAQLSAQLAAAVTNSEYADTLNMEPALNPAQLRGVVLNCGIYDVPAMKGGSGLVGWGVRQALWAYAGEREFEDSRAAAEMSVIRWVDADFPATYISGGNSDPLTDTQSRPLAEKLTELGVATTPVFYPAEQEPELAHEYQFDLTTEAAREALAATVNFARQVTG